MFNAAALSPVEPPRISLLDPDVEFDGDGYAIPEIWRYGKGRQNWDNFPASLRAEKSRRFLIDRENAALSKPKPARLAAKRFSTDYAIAWGRSHGWKLRDRERYDLRLKRHHDIPPFSADALFLGSSGMIHVQGAGRSERKYHHQKFEAGGGIDMATLMRIEFYYLEFERGNPEPIKLERWA